MFAGNRYAPLYDVKREVNNSIQYTLKDSTGCMKLSKSGRMIIKKTFILKSFHNYFGITSLFIIPICDKNYRQNSWKSQERHKEICHKQTQIMGDRK